MKKQEGIQRISKHNAAIEILKREISSLRHEQESMFLAGEFSSVNALQNTINQIVSSLVHLNESSLTRPLHKNTIKKLRNKIEKKQIKENKNISFDTMWHDSKICAIVPLKLLEHMSLEV